MRETVGKIIIAALTALYYVYALTPILFILTLAVKSTNGASRIEVIMLIWFIIYMILWLIGEMGSTIKKKKPRNKQGEK